MDYYKLKLMTREDMLRTIESLGKSYAPKWHFNLQEPDLGSALALIFTDMYTELIERAKKLPNKHHVDFLNLLEPMQRSASGAKGHVVFSLSEGTTQGIGLEQGRQVLGVNELGETVVFETSDNLWLSPAKLTHMFMVSSSRDAIAPIYEAELGVDMRAFFMPMDTVEPNLQQHTLTIEAPGVLKLRTALGVEVYIEDQQSKVRRDQLVGILSRADMAEWSYSENGVWQPFTEVHPIEGGIRLGVKGSLSLELEALRLTLKNPLRIECDALSLKPIATAKEPDVLYANEVQLPLSECLMFGSQFYAYDACYIASDEVFSKAGAEVVIEMDYLMIGAESPFEVPEPQVKWKNVLRKSDIPEVKVKPICISEVVVEYWNGLGWSSLALKVFDRQMFKKEVGEMIHAKLVFDCPIDLKPSMVGAFENRWIRLRIAGIENAYTLSGIYQLPKLKKMQLSYRYGSKGVMPTALTCCEFLQQRTIDLDQPPLTLFESYGDLSGEAIYLCFDKPLQHGPLKLLMDLGTVVKGKKPKFSFQMLRRVGGHRKWTELEVLDDTKGLTETGLISFIGDETHDKLGCFGKEGYWLRIKQIESGNLPVLVEGVYLNAAPVIQKETKLSQYYSLKSYEYGKHIALPHNQLEHLTLWVDEIELDEEALQALELPYQIVKSQDGQIENQWVQWAPYEDLSQMGEKTRGYLVNLFEGCVDFGDTINGYLPEGQNHLNVRIDYALTQGNLGNLASHAVQTLGSAVPYVNTLTNPLPMAGGKAPESKQDALARTSASLRHHQRALTLGDINDLVQSADYDISQVKTLSGYSKEGRPVPGQVISAVLPRRLSRDNDYFDALKAGIYERIKTSLPCTLIPERNFFVIEPTQVTIDVHLKGRLEHMNRYLEVQKAAQAAIEDYLDTYGGGPLGEGWKLGEIPRYQDLLATIQKIDGMAEVTYLILNASVTDGYQMKEVSLETLRDNPFMIVKSGIPTIILSTSS